MIRVDYTRNPATEAKRLEPEQASYWRMMLEAHKPSAEWATACVRSPYMDNSAQPLYFLRLTHTPTNKVVYAKALTLLTS